MPIHRHVYHVPMHAYVHWCSDLQQWALTRVARRYCLWWALAWRERQQYHFISPNCKALKLGYNFHLPSNATINQKRGGRCKKRPKYWGMSNNVTSLFFCRKSEFVTDYIHTLYRSKMISYPYKNPPTTFIYIIQRGRLNLAAIFPRDADYSDPFLAYCWLILRWHHTIINWKWFFSASKLHATIHECIL